MEVAARRRMVVRVAMVIFGQTIFKTNGKRFKVQNRNKALEVQDEDSEFRKLNITQ